MKRPPEGEGFTLVDRATIRGLADLLEDARHALSLRRLPLDQLLGEALTLEGVIDREAAAQRAEPDAGRLRRLDRLRAHGDLLQAEIVRRTLDSDPDGVAPCRCPCGRDAVCLGGPDPETADEPRCDACCDHECVARWCEPLDDDGGEP